MADLYQASHENIKRAERKFNDLMGTINRFLDERPSSVRVEVNGNLAHIIARREKEVPTDVAFDAVEIVQRLRIALDKMLVNAVDARGVGTSGIGFPFGGFDKDTGQILPFPDGRTEDRLKKKLTSDEWKFVRAQRPYPGGNETLWAINELANEDKHRKDLVALRPEIDQRLSVRLARGGNGYVDHLSFGNFPQFQHVLADKEREAILFSIGRVAARNLNVEQHLSGAVVFSAIVPIDGKNVLTLLNQQIRITKIILRGWERL